jgi:hypothetical protein
MSHNLKSERPAQARRWTSIGTPPPPEVRFEACPGENVDVNRDATPARWYFLRPFVHPLLHKCNMAHPPGYSNLNFEVLRGCVKRMFSYNISEAWERVLKTISNPLVLCEFLEIHDFRLYYIAGLFSVMPNAHKLSKRGIHGCHEWLQN